MVGTLRILGCAAIVAALGTVVEAQSLQYRAIGARNDATAGTGKAATVVVCTNIGSFGDDIQVKFYNFDGSLVCTLGTIEPFVGTTVTYATQPVEMFPGASTCGYPGPSINQGIVEMRGYTQIVCSVFVVDPNTNPPAYLANLETIAVQ